MKHMGRVVMALAVAGILTFTAMQGLALEPPMQTPPEEPKELKAKYILADDMYNRKDFAGAVENALAAKNMLGRTNPRIDSILARAYAGMGKPIQAYEALERYLKLAKESDKDYAELVALYAKVKVEAEKKQAEEASSYLNNIEMVKVPAGCFHMGNTFDDGYIDEQPVHEVCVDAFSIGKFEVTQGLWLAVMGSNPAVFKKGLDYPVEKVSWDDVQEFLMALNAKLGKTFRLPTEAEWEYACRSGGKKEKYCGGDKIGGLVWYDENSGGAPHSVGQKNANGLGLYDMSGNVNEWVHDWYDKNYYTTSPKQNPAGPESGAFRVYRGGGWYDGSTYLAGVGFWHNASFGDTRAAHRNGNQLGYSSNNLGFRLAMSISSTETATPDASEKPATGWNW